MGRLRNFWKTANEIKSAWEWWAILATLGIGVPAAPIVVNVLTGASLDVLLLYLVAAVAFWFVFVNEGIPALDELFGRRHRRTVAALIRLREEGVQLRNRDVRGDVQWMHFHADFKAWDQAVISAMENGKVRASDIARFKTLDLVPDRRFPHSTDELHAKDLRELSEKLARLMEITASFEKTD